MAHAPVVLAAAVVVLLCVVAVVVVALVGEVLEADPVAQADTMTPADCRAPGPVNESVTVTREENPLDSMATAGLTSVHTSGPVLNNSASPIVPWLPLIQLPLLPM